ncbi:uncharacterized protein C16orf46 homolog isoform X2 [Hyperolius riggenbachi]|uniref:uncharacterized protein C16orf46 homolog isoform X2 n=1 Tax=Hyperolius riggenbachi TaxID=752182 RepID=UPI0035A307F6
MGNRRVILEDHPMADIDNYLLLGNLEDGEETVEKVCLPREGNEEKVCSPREGKEEKDLTEALLGISERLPEEEHKSLELLMGTGWEEAVCGWGPVSATACLYPQKKLKKLKAAESADCLLCLDLYIVPDNKDGTSCETKAMLQDNHKETTVAEHKPGQTITPPAEEDLPSGFTDHCPSTGLVATTETHCDTVSEVSTAEQRQTKNAQRMSSPLTGRVIPVCTNCYNTKEFPMFLPPLKLGTDIGHAEHMARRREFLMQQLEKLPSKGFVGGALANQILSNTDLRADRRLLQVLSELPQEQPSEPESLTFPKRHMNESDHLQWPRSLLEHRLNAATDGHYSVKHHGNPASMGFLHTRTIQNRRNVRQDTRTLNDTRSRRAKSDTTPLIRNTVLPSLTVTRVEIPPRIKMC